MCQFRDAAEGLPCAMDFDVDRYLRQSNARFLASINSILERYNHPFEDDLLVSMETLTYDTPDGPKNWENVSTKEVKEWREKVLECNREGRRNAEMSKQQSSDFEQERSTVHQESPENSRVDTSDIDEASDAGKVSVRGKFGDVHFQNLYVGDRSIQEKAKVQVDMIVQVDCARKIPKWMTIAPQGLLEGLHLASPAQELIGNQAAVYREKGELSNECSSSRLLQLPFSDVSNSLDTITIPRHQLSPELSKTCCDSTLGDYQFADDECSFSNVTLADLYPAMVRILTRLIKRESRRRLLKYMFGYSRHKRWCSRRPKLNVTVDKIRGFRPLKQRQALLGIGGCRNEDIQDQTLGNENKELRDGKCSTDNFSGLVPYSYIDTDEIKMDYTDSSFGCHLVSAKGHEVSKVTGAPDVATMGGAFLAEDEIQTAVSLKNSKCKESKKLAYKCSSEYCFITSASSGSAALHLVKESKTRNIYFPYGDTSELCSSTWSSYGSSNTITPVTNCSPAKASNTLLINPEKRISEGPISFQCKHSFSSLFVKQSPSKMHQKCEDAFEELYYSLCPKEIQKPLTLTRPLSSSKNLEEKKLMKRHLSDSVRSSMRYDKEFDRIYEQLHSEAVPKLPGFQRASNLRQYEGIQMSETVSALCNSPVQSSASNLRQYKGIQMSGTVNALCNSPVQTLFAIPRGKRQRNSQNDPCPPVKRLKFIPEQYFPSAKCQQTSHRTIVNLQAVGMDFFSTSNGSNPSFFDIHSCWSQGSGFHASSGGTLLAIPGTSLQESGIAGTHSSRPSTMTN